MQFVLADTDIKIKTPEFTEIHLTVLDPDADYSAFAIYKKTSDAYGDAVFTYTGDALVFDLMVVLKKSDKTIYSNKFRENYVAGETVSLEVIPNGYELKETPTISAQVTAVDDNVTVASSVEENSTDENITAVVEEPETEISIQEETPKNNSGFLSSFLRSEGNKEKKDGQSSKEIYYVGALVLLAGLGFFIFKGYQTPRQIKVTKLSEIQQPQHPKFDSKNIDELIRDATDRIKSAQKEIETLKKYKE